MSFFDHSTGFISYCRSKLVGIRGVWISKSFSNTRKSIPRFYYRCCTVKKRKELELFQTINANPELRKSESTRKKVEAYKHEHRSVIFTKRRSANEMRTGMVSHAIPIFPLARSTGWEDGRAAGHEALEQRQTQTGLQGLPVLALEVGPRHEWKVVPSVGGGVWVITNKHEHSKGVQKNFPTENI